MSSTAFETRLTSVQEMVRLRLGESWSDPPLPRPAHADLTKALAALLAAGEELRQQNEELVATRQLAEEQWRRYEELFEQAPDAYVVTDPLGVIQEANRAAVALLQVPERPVGKPLLLYVDASDRPALLRLLARPTPSLRTEVCLLPKSGALVPAAVSATEVRAPGGERRGLRFLLRDLSQVERTTQALRESEASFRTIFEHSFSAILILDDDGRILEANPAALSLTGLDRGQLLGRRLAELLLDDAWALGESGALAKLRRADGALLSLTLTSRRVLTPGRRLVFALDVTALEAVTADRDLLRALSVHRFQAQDEALRRIARELHDEAGELLTSVHLRLDQLTKTLPAARRRVREVRSLLDEVEQRLRRISHELRPIMLDDLGLVSALEHLAEGAASRTKAAIEVEANDVGRLSPAVETALYRIAQEALANALRHARAKRILIRVTRQVELVTLSVEDDGVGLDAFAREKGSAARRKGLGLAGMRERAESLGGVLDLRAAPPHGLEVRVRVPL